MVCRDVDKGDLAEKYLKGQLDPATQDDFELHILECRDCQHFLAALQAARDDLESHAHEIRSHSSFTRGGLQWAWVGAAALSVIALSLGITRFALHHRGRPQVAQQKPPASNLPENKIDVRVQEADKLQPTRVPKIESAPSTAVMPIIGRANRGARTRRDTLSVDGADASDNSVKGIRATVTQEGRQESQLMRKPDNAQPDLQALADLPLNARSPANVVSASRGEPTHSEVSQNLDELRTDNYLSHTLVNSPLPDSLPIPGMTRKSLAKSAKAKTQQPASSQHAALPSRNDEKSSGIASSQVDHLLIKNKADAPLQITEAHCGQNEHGDNCQAKLRFADTKETWDGYGLLWTIMLETGSKSLLHQAADRSIEPTGGPDGSYQPSGRYFKPGEIVTVGSIGAGFGTTDGNGKALRVTDAQVEVEFVINTNGTVWGDSESATYLHMVEARKKAKEGTQ